MVVKVEGQAAQTDPVTCGDLDRTAHPRRTLHPRQPLRNVASPLAADRLSVAALETVGLLMVVLPFLVWSGT